MAQQQQHNNLFDILAGESESPAALAAALAPEAAPGHFDELRGQPTPMADVAAADPPPAPSAPSARHEAAPPEPPLPNAPITPDWRTFFDSLQHDDALQSEGLADLPRRARNLRQQLHDNGVTYNVYADANGPARPWSLDLFPLIVSPQSWARIEAGVLQRTRLLEQVLADVYGPQRLLREGLLPAALVRGHPGYLRPLQGVQPAGGTWLRMAAFDLGRGPDGHWWLVSQRTQAPSGLGYLLENRLAVARQFSQAFAALQVQRLAATYSALMDGLQAMCPGDGPPHIALLTPGPYNETYFEHAYLARYLGVTLVEGSDLTVRGERLYLKTLQGLRPVHGLIKRVDDAYLDPLELRPDSTLGVPGLLQAVRAGNLLVANTPGTAFLESPALLGFLPALARQLLGQDLQLPALPTWWCGERAALEAALPQLADCTLKPTYPGFDTVLAARLGPREREAWVDRIREHGEAHTLQSYLRLSQMPSWASGHADGGPAHPPGDAGHIVPKAVMLRIFAISDGPQSWRVLPGGLARLAGGDAQVAAMQRGGSSADVWVRTEGEVDRSTRLVSTGVAAAPQALPRAPHARAPVTSRAAENMFWLGRYTERAENSLQLARLALDPLHGDDPCSPALLAWLLDLARRNALVPPALPDIGSGPHAAQARRLFERALIAELGPAQPASGLGFTLRGLHQAAAAVRERLSPSHWKFITQAEAQLRERLSTPADAGSEGRRAVAATLHALEDTATLLSAITGAQTDHMTRDDAWRLLSIGRHIERLGFLSQALAAGLAHGTVREMSGFEALIALFDSTITFHARHQQHRTLSTLLDLLLIDPDNPRSLAWVARTLRGRIAHLTHSAPGVPDELARLLPDPDGWNPQTLGLPDAEGGFGALRALLDACERGARQLSDAIGARYFTLTAEAPRSVGL